LERWTPRGCALVAFGRPLLIGLVAGFLSGYLGIGGGVILVPAMTILLHLPQHRAHGTSLAAVLLIAASGAHAYSKAGYVHWGAAGWLVVGVIAGAIVGAKLAGGLPAARLRQIFGIFLVAISIYMVTKSALAWNPTNHAEVAVPVGAVIAVGLLAGLMSGILGIGGGVLVIPAMVLLLGVSQKIAQGISLVVIIPASVSGALVYARRGDVDSFLALLIGLGGLLGAQLSATWAHHTATGTLQICFAIFLALTGMWMCLRAFGKRPRAARVIELTGGKG